MEFCDFVKAAHEAGINTRRGSNYMKIRELWKKVFPVSAKLQERIDGLESELFDKHLE